MVPKEPILSWRNADERRKSWDLRTLHDYQNKICKIHSEKFPHLPFDVYKSRIKIVRDEAVIEKWKEEMSTLHYNCLQCRSAAGLESSLREEPPDSSGERDSERGDGDLVAERCAQAAQPSDLRDVSPFAGRAEAFPA